MVRQPYQDLYIERGGGGEMGPELGQIIFIVFIVIGGSSLMIAILTWLSDLYMLLPLSFISMLISGFLFGALFEALSIMFDESIDKAIYEKGWSESWMWEEDYFAAWIERNGWAMPLWFFLEILPFLAPILILYAYFY